MRPRVAGGSSLAVGSSIAGSIVRIALPPRRGHVGGDRWRDRDCHRPSLPGRARPVASILTPTFRESTPPLPKVRTSASVRGSRVARDDVQGGFLLPGARRTISRDGQP